MCSNSSCAQWTCGSSGCGWECITTSGDQESLDNEKGEDNGGKILGVASAPHHGEPHKRGGKTHKRGGPPGSYIAEEVQVYDDDSWYWDDGYCGGSYKWTCGSSGCGWECITSGDQESLDNEKGEDSDGKIPKYLRSVIS